VVIGWIGSNTTAPYLRMLVRALDQITEKYPHVDVRVVGGSYVPPIVHNLQVRRWDLEQELDELHGFDIGIMPMPDTEWTRGKCGFKALLYMSVGIPPVCSPVGVTTDILQDGYNGLLATTTEEWVDRLSMLIEDVPLRRKMGDAGRQWVLERFSLHAQAPRFLDVLQRAYRGERSALSPAVSSQSA
jgi:glycosyltransferase involved in cell wall biosynthesis